ncbi:HAAS signaling domain-containing protein [Actinoplanes philippinensis]|uniref:HAAS signaling domain-containing protein n=1 Tax=Actinoplanes philippinensis TaxID=35752 RepID=UPI0033D10F1D
MTQTDELVAAYLARVERAASRLPAGRREELLGDLREHIEIARAESDAGTEAEVRTILDRLGDPESIVAAADTQTDLPRVTPAAPAPPAPPAPPVARRPAAPTARWVGLGVLAVIVMILFCGSALFMVRDEGGPAERPVPPPQPTRTEEPRPSVGP